MSTIILSALFVGLLAVYLYTLPDDDARNGPARPTITIEKVPSTHQRVVGGRRRARGACSGAVATRHPVIAGERHQGNKASTRPALSNVSLEVGKGSSPFSHRTVGIGQVDLLPDALGRTSPHRVTSGSASTTSTRCRPGRSPSCASRSVVSSRTSGCCSRSRWPRTSPSHSR